MEMLDQWEGEGIEGLELDAEDVSRALRHFLDIARKASTDLEIDTLPLSEAVARALREVRYFVEEAKDTVEFASFDD